MRFQAFIVHAAALARLGQANPLPGIGQPQTPLRLAATLGISRRACPPPSLSRKMTKAETPEQPLSLNLPKKKAATLGITVGPCILFTQKVATPGMDGPRRLLRLRLSRKAATSTLN
ncbi:hypothetical protein LEL_06727 [Akanthomyces lecanii RCEF 1005]|uniref:Uncharacterized protein n=1 Tax=Akanthomyces lecanii RCEF 1005 TaxID=1081108 RepID=A0A168GXI4_CORDF|nr:hypothetical protein LEL_06727 [Akanthomyces lecanii RCEF 1005]